MRTISDLKTAIAQARKNHTFYGYMEAELRSAIIDGIPSDRLEAICDAERDGRCVALPCKVGDTVYCLNYNVKTEEREIAPSRVKYVRYDTEPKNNIYVSDGNFIRTLGVHAWLTREAAEKALKERG